jgi:hypothetical protein
MACTLPHLGSHAIGAQGIVSAIEIVFDNATRKEVLVRSATM